MAQLKLIGCIPVKDLPDKTILYEEEEQEITQENCPHCEQEMWISAYKKQLRQAYNDVEVLCYVCIAHLTRGQNIVCMNVNDFHKNVFKN